MILDVIAKLLFVNAFCAVAFVIWMQILLGLRLWAQSSHNSESSGHDDRFAGFNRFLKKEIWPTLRRRWSAAWVWAFYSFLALLLVAGIEAVVTN